MSSGPLTDRIWATAVTENEQPLPVAKAVLLYIGFVTTGDGYMALTQREIATATGYSARTVAHTLQDLLRLGFLQVADPVNGEAKRYRVVRSKLARVPAMLRVVGE